MNNAIQKIRILQHNVAKLTNTMISCLEYALNQNSDIIFMQELGIEANLTSISHPSFDGIILTILDDLMNEIKSRTMTFISKKSNIKITPRPDILNDSDIEMLHVTNTEIENFLIFNVYNEKNQKIDNNEYIIERTLINIKLTLNSIICDDFNAHHAGGNSRISSSIKANHLIDGLTKFRCELINTSDEITFSRNFKHENDDEIRTSTSIIDLTFATPKIAEQITDGSINKNAATGSNYEVIEFSINVSKVETFDNSINEAFNVNKADGEKFESFLKSNLKAVKNSMKNLIKIFNFDETATTLQKYLIDAAEFSIPRRKFCEKSKK